MLCVTLLVHVFIRPDLGFEPRPILVAIQSQHALWAFLLSPHGKPLEHVRKCTLFGVTEVMVTSCVLMLQPLRASIQMASEVSLWN